MIRDALAYVGAVALSFAFVFVCAWVLAKAKWGES